MKGNRLTVRDSAKDSYAAHVRRWQHCNLCPLHKIRGKIVFVRGCVPAPILFLGEGPGESENVLGYPFVGEAGRLIDTLIQDSLPVDMLYAIGNILACWPHDRSPTTTGQTRPPNKLEIKSCSTRLHSLILLCKPQLVVTLGQVAKSNCPDGEYAKLALVHPSYILRCPVHKAKLETARFTVNLKAAIRKL